MLDLSSRNDDIHAKGFNMISTRPVDGRNPIDYSKIRVGVKSLDDAVINFGELSKLNDRLANKENI